MIYLNGDCLSLSFPCTLFVFMSQFLYLVQAYLHSIYNQAVTFTRTPVLQEAEKQHFFKEIGGCLN